MSLRTARLSDAAAVARVHHLSWIEAYGELLPASYWETHTLAARTRTWQRWLLGNGRLHVAEVSGEIVGIAYAAPPVAQYGVEPVRDQQLWMLYVLREHHGTGVGQALLDAAVHPASACQLWVAEENPRARRFYERNGFVLEGARITDEQHANISELRMVR